jgi:hypothetical protein
VSWRIVVQEQNSLSQFALLLRVISQFFCIVCTVYGTTLLKIVNPDYPKKLKPSSSLLMAPS